LTLSARYIGTAGEHLACSVLHSFGWTAAMVDAGGFDLLAILDTEILRVQVKTTLRRIDGYGYQWQTNKGGSKDSLTLDDCDIVACVALDLRKLVFFHVTDLSKQRTRRVAHSKMIVPELEYTSWETALTAARALYP
jgi:hypothetical protein